MPEHDAVQAAVDQHRALQQALSAWFSEIDDDFNGELAPIHEALLGLPAHRLAALGLVRADAQLAAWREGVEAAAQLIRPAADEFVEIEEDDAAGDWGGYVEDASRFIEKRVRALPPPATIPPPQALLSLDDIEALAGKGPNPEMRQMWADYQRAKTPAAAPPAGGWEQGREAAARWHEERAARLRADATEQRQRIGAWKEADARAWMMDAEAERHDAHAVCIRLLPPPAPVPAPGGEGLREALEPFARYAEVAAEREWPKSIAEDPSTPVLIIYGTGSQDEAVLAEVTVGDFQRAARLTPAAPDA